VATLAQQFEKVALATPHLDQALTGEVPGHQALHRVQVTLERRRQGLFVLVVAVVAEQGGVEGLVVDQTGTLVLNQAQIAAGGCLRAGGIGEGAILQYGQADRTIQFIGHQVLLGQPAVA